MFEQKHIYWLKCDACHFSDFSIENDFMPLSPTDVRKAAYDKGWRHFRLEPTGEKKDICPTCLDKRSKRGA